MHDLTQLIENLDEQELKELLSLIPLEIKERQAIQKILLKNEIIALYKEVNNLGRNIYTIGEIATLVNTKEYIVSDAIKEYKNNLKDN